MITERKTSLYFYWLLVAFILVMSSQLLSDAAAGKPLCTNAGGLTYSTVSRTYGKNWRLDRTTLGTFSPI
jgi:predicted membrane channel-forming protein YqfA (hemolysin III family)